VTRKLIRFAVLAAAVALTAPGTAHERDSARYVTHSLAVAGKVREAQTLDLEALAALPRTEIPDVPMRCSPERDKGTSTWGGVLLRDLLDRVGVDTDEHHSRNYTYIVATASDGYKVVFSWHEIFNSPVGDGVLVTLDRDGRPLEEDGRIGLMSTRDTFTCGRHVKWLERIEVLRQ
jgi:DMSO/TMAO reductase YedYZ molybdopterin-dependent catalytic subunit